MTQMSKYSINAEMRTDKRTPAVTWNDTILKTNKGLTISDKAELTSWVTNRL
jgi:hypothetical protein